MTDDSKKRFSGILRTAVKFAVAAGVVIWLYHHKSGDLRTGFASFDYLLLLPALGCSLISSIAASLRWRSLAGMIDIPLTGFQAFSLTMQGMFFSLVIPGGAVGGDVVKMAVLTKHVKSGSRTEGIFSILMDRIIGMIALFLLALIILLSAGKYFTGLHIGTSPDLPSGTALRWIFIIFCAAGLAAGIAVFCHRLIEKLPGMKTIRHFIDRKSSGKVTRIANAVDIYAKKRFQLGLWVILTLFIIHLAPAVSMLCLLSGSGAGLHMLPVIMAVVLGNIAGLIPLFPGGIGARDAVTVALLIAAGYSPETAGMAQLMSTLLLIIFNLAGSLFFIADRKKYGETK